MKTQLIAAVLASFAVVAFAECRQLTDEEKKLLAADYQKLSPEDQVKRNAAIEIENLIEGGGYMLMPGTPSGSIRIVNLQRKISSADLAKTSDAFSSLQPYDIKVVEKDEPATLKIKIVDEATAPSLALYPDEGLAVVNVARLEDEKTRAKPAFLASRTRKEIVRAFAYMTAGSSYGTPIFNRIATPKELDQYAGEGFPMDIIMRSAQFLKSMGVLAAEEVTYRDVLENGYDLAPTNDYQKAIYEQVRKNVKFTKKIK